jgi:transcriptional regulator with XRE-family HTH domain
VEAVLQQLGANLRRRRRAARLSQEELAHRAELDRTLISSIERGKKLIRIDTVVKLAYALGLSPSELLEGVVYAPALRRRDAS